MECPKKDCIYWVKDKCILTYAFEDYEIKMKCREKKGDTNEAIQ